MEFLKRVSFCALCATLAPLTGCASHSAPGVPATSLGAARSSDSNARRAGTSIETVLFNFGLGAEGANPQAGVISDATGNLYGTTTDGGTYNHGTIFQLQPSGSSYDERVIWDFPRGRRGKTSTAGLALDAAGRLYGTTIYGGNYGRGTLFHVSTFLPPNKHDAWNFGSGSDGRVPISQPVIGPDGGLYGTTELGGLYGGGTVYQVVRSGHTYSERVLYNFGASNDGCSPAGPLTFDNRGAIYGATLGGSAAGCQGHGTVFKLTPSGSGYTESVLWAFAGPPNDGSTPTQGVAIARSGALFGTTMFGGNGGGCSFECGTVFKLTPSRGKYTERVIWNFAGPADGYYPDSNVIVGPRRRLYGTTYMGGNGNGSLFELAPAGAQYTKKILWSFGYGSDGYAPRGWLLAGKDGAFYGTTEYGGSNKWFGTVFKVVP